MKRTLSLLLIGSLLSANIAKAQKEFDPAHADVYVTPYYNSAGPAIDVGRFSKGLASKNESEFVTTIGKMKESWDKLSFVELYVASIRLYDLGDRKESIYWYYTAQYRGRLFGTLLDQQKMGSIGAPGFELLQAQTPSFSWQGHISPATHSQISITSSV